jgi:hypothetical protein
VALVSIDVFATTNPAYCSLVLRAFVEGYMQGDKEGVPLPLVILPLPLVATESIANTLASTNASTGLLPWISRNPEVTIGMSERLAKTAGFSQDGLLFGIRFGILTISKAGRVITADAGLKKKLKLPATEEPGRGIALSRRIGIWAGQVQSPETVFISLGANR